MPLPKKIATRSGKGTAKTPDNDIASDSDKSPSAEKPVSLHPLKFEDALRELARTKPKTTG